MTRGDQDLIDGTADHDCRTRVRDGHAERTDTDVLDAGHVQLEFECDLCGRRVWLHCEPFNIQIEQYDSDKEHLEIIEPGGCDRSEIYETGQLYAR